MVTWFDADDVTRFRLQKIVEVTALALKPSSRIIEPPSHFDAIKYNMQQL